MSLAPLPAEDVDRIVELYEEGLSLQEVARRMFVSPSAVHRYLVARGVPRRPPGGNGGHPVVGDDDMARTVELYQSGLSEADVGRELGLHWTTVGNRLTRAGVQRRSRSEQQRIAWRTKRRG